MLIILMIDYFQYNKLFFFKVLDGWKDTKAKSLLTKKSDV
jgi:hypothetical protein